MTHSNTLEKTNMLEKSNITEKHTWQQVGKNSPLQASLRPSQRSSSHNALMRYDLNPSVSLANALMRYDITADDITA